MISDVILPRAHHRAWRSCCQCAVAAPDAIFVPVGGGGLLAGIAVYVKYLYPQVQGHRRLSCATRAGMHEARCARVSG